MSPPPPSPSPSSNSGDRFEVTLAVYDLSNGLASQLSASILGTHLSGIYHTGVRVYEYEYFYGGGIQKAPSGMTPYGRPVRVEQLGYTTKTFQQFQQFLATIDQQFSMDNYHLLNHNCNHFSHECLKFLINNQVQMPNDVLQMVETVKNSPMGPMIIPFIESMHQQAGIGVNGSYRPQQTQTQSQAQAQPVTTTTQSKSRPIPDDSHTNKLSFKLLNDWITLRSGNEQVIKKRIMEKTNEKNELTFDKLYTFCQFPNDEIAFPSLDLLRLSIFHSFSFSPSASVNLSDLLTQHITSCDDVKSNEKSILMALRLTVNCISKWPKDTIPNAHEAICDSLDKLLTPTESETGITSGMKWLHFKAAIFVMRNFSVALVNTESDVKVDEVLVRLFYLQCESIKRFNEEFHEKGEKDRNVVLMSLIESIIVCIEFDPVSGKDLLNAYDFDISNIKVKHDTSINSTTATNNELIEHRTLLEKLLS